LNDDEVKRSLWAAKFRLRQIAGKDAYKAYEDSGPPRDTVEALRADLLRILDLSYWFYSLLPLRNSMRVRHIFWSIFWVSVYTLVFGGWLAVSHHLHWIPVTGLIASVIYFGLVGGYVSSMRRLQGLEFDQGDPIVGIYGLKGATYFMLLSPMLGATFAIILSLFFAGGLLKGGAFPEFHQQPVANLADFIIGLHPDATKDYALLMIWSFIAGFAERLVPDNLDKLIASQKSRHSTSE
jgi:hypothetical protein